MQGIAQGSPVTTLNRQQAMKENMPQGSPSETGYTTPPPSGHVNPQAQETPPGLQSVILELTSSFSTLSDVISLKNVSKYLNSDI